MIRIPSWSWPLDRPRTFLSSTQMHGVVSGQESMFFVSHPPPMIKFQFGCFLNRIMEHLDSLAGSIAYKHLLGPVQCVGNLKQRGFYLVTASVDRFVLLN